MHACLCTYTNYIQIFSFLPTKWWKPIQRTSDPAQGQINWTGNELGEYNTTHTWSACQLHYSSPANRRKGNEKNPILLHCHKNHSSHPATLRVAWDDPSPCTHTRPCLHSYFITAGALASASICPGHGAIGGNLLSETWDKELLNRGSVISCHSSCSVLHCNVRI